MGLSLQNMAEILHIEDLLDRLLAEFSGGQQQGIAIARAFVKDAQVLLLDEPLVNGGYKLPEELRQNWSVDVTDEFVLFVKVSTRVANSDKNVPLTVYTPPF